MGNEKSTDQFVRDMLREIEVPRPWEQDGGPQWKRSALRASSKSASMAGEGKPEFVFERNGHVIVIEDKRDVSKTRLIVDDVITTEYPARAEYALNGAVHYAQCMMANGIPHEKGIFAVGVGGGETHFEIAVAHVTSTLTRRLDDLDNFGIFAEDQIDEYYDVQVRGHRPRAEAQLDDVRAAAKKLHEGMRNYGSVENNRKAPLVSAILLALRYEYFDISNLKGLTPGNNAKVWDGRIIYDAAEEYMRSESLMPNQKIGTLLDQFAFIRNSVALNRVHDDLGVSPLRWMTRILENHVAHVVSDPSLTAFDVLGNFYHEFISYGGGDGSGLGIVLTPDHITTLMAELIDISASDYVLDPTAGTASFLIAAMQRMFADAGDDEQLKETIRSERLHGIELQDKLFAIGTTNMILRGDGKANFRRDNIFDAPMAEMRGDRVENDRIVHGHGFTKVLLNPPYSQSKSENTRGLSELAFIEKALEYLNPGGRLAAIVPQSAMVGKTTADKARKRKILRDHTLETVVSMNAATFTNSGHTPNTVIVIITAGRPHPADAKVKFVNFAKDGYRVLPHRGLVADGTADSRRKHLFEVLRGDAQDDTRFIVRSTVTPEDEWQHSYFYFNDQPSRAEDFLATAADYVTWKVEMQTHGFGERVFPGAGHTNRCRFDWDGGATPRTPADFEVAPMLITEIFDSMESSKAWFDKSKMSTDGDPIYPYITRKGAANGLDTFFPRQRSKEPEVGNAITLGLDTQTLGYQASPFYTSQNVQVMRHAELDPMTAIVLMTVLKAQMGKFSWGGNGATLGRLRRTRVLIPIVSTPGNKAVIDWGGMRKYGQWILREVQSRIALD